MRKADIKSKAGRVAIVLMTVLGCNLSGADISAVNSPFQPAWESLTAHKNPEWFRDAKFGIYTHWGPVTVGSENAPRNVGQYYGRDLYDRTKPEFEYHKKTFGDQSTVGYKDIIPLFKAEKFDADAWADLFARAGAKFAGPVAVHHDNFAMWNSEVTPWNAAKMGPHRDIVGELGAAIKARGMKFVTTFHHAYAWGYFDKSFEFDGADPKNAKLYGSVHLPGSYSPTKEYRDQWLGMVNEVVTKYQPDMLWFDFEWTAYISPEYQRRMFADYYNWAARNNRESMVAIKNPRVLKFTGVLDIECGREDRLTPYPWLTDTVLADWFNNKATPYRTLDYMVQMLVDIVSKNGCMMLDVSPNADGTIPEQAKKVLLGMGDWLKINGEAIYSTRPWIIYGEGPTPSAKSGSYNEAHDKPFTPQDLRFTTKGDTLYAIALGWPEDRKLQIRSLAPAAGKIKSVSLLGSSARLEWTQTADGLQVTLPETKPCENAFTLKIDAGKLQHFDADESAVEPGADGSVLLAPDDARLHGEQICIDKKGDDTFLCNWGDPSEWPSWAIHFRSAGRYEVILSYSGDLGDSELVVDLAGQKLSGTARKTDGWYAFQTLKLGTIELTKPGKQELGLRARDAAQWKAINVRDVTLKKIH